MELLANAFRYMAAHWQDDRANALGDTTGADRLRALTRWSMNTTGYDDAVRRMWIARLATDQPPTSTATDSRRQAHRERDDIGAIVSTAYDDDHDWLADVLFLAFRGYYISSIEDPEQWSSDRAAAALERLLDLAESTAPGTDP
jgi:hypothetical protein